MNTKTRELRIRKVPTKVHKWIKLEAVRDGISINDKVNQILKKHCSEAARFSYP